MNFHLKSFFIEITYFFRLLPRKNTYNFLLNNK